LDFGQTIRDKAEVLLGKSWGTTSELGEPCGNKMRTHLGTRGKTKITSPSPLPNRKKLNPLSAFSLTA